MKILLLTDHFYPDLSSGGRLLTDLALGLVKAGDQVRVITAFASYNTTESGSPEENYLGIQIERVKSTNLLCSSIIGRLVNEISFCFVLFFRVLYSTGIDVIITISSPPFLPFFVMVLSKIKRIPYTYVVMDVFPDIAINMGLLKPDSLIINFWEMLSRLTLQNAARIVVLGRCMYNVISKKLSNLNVPIDIIHNWSNAEVMNFIPRDTNPFFTKYSYLKDKFIVQYSGNLGRFHEFETILAAAKELENKTRIHFLIIGEGFQRQWLLNEVEKHNLKNVTLLPFQPQEDLVYSLNAADVALVTLKRGAEGLGVPSKFYPVLAVGKPVVAVMNEWAEVALTVKEFGIGITLEQGDTDSLTKAIKQLLSDSNELAQMGKRSRQLFLDRFDRPKAIQAYQKCLRLAAGLDG
jgi:glycosyltransferase involved in cell wall biosynthesis